MKKITRYGIPALVTVLVLSAFVGNFAVANAQLSPDHPGTNMPFPPEGGFRGRGDDSATTSAKMDLKLKLQAQFGKGTTTASTTKDRGNLEKELRAKMRGIVGNFLANFMAHFDKVNEKLMAVFTRLTNIADRIDSRLAKLSAQKIDVSVSTKFVASGRQELKLAKMAIDAAAADFKLEMTGATNLNASTTATNITATTSTTATTTIGGRNFRTIFTKTFADIASAKDHLKKAHAYLVQAISNIKPGQGDEGNNGNSTTTTATTTVTASSSASTPVTNTQ